MTIKQQGGIFGRNPTFNDLTAGSGSSIEGSGANVSFRVDRTDASTDGALVLTAKGAVVDINSDGADKDLTFSTASGTERARFFGDQGGFWLRSGNLVIDSGYGIDFSATSGTGTSELFDDYEEGTWTPVVTAGAGTLTTVTIASAVYTKIGRMVTVHAKFTLTNAGTGSGSLSVAGFPYVINNDYGNGVVVGRNVSNTNLIFGQLVGTVSSAVTIRNYDNSDPIVNGDTYTITATYAV